MQPGREEEKRNADTSLTYTTTSLTYKQQQQQQQEANYNNVSAQQVDCWPASKRAGATSGQSSSQTAAVSSSSSSSSSYSKLFSLQQYLSYKLHQQHAATTATAAASASHSAADAGRRSTSGAASKLIASALNRFQRSSEARKCSSNQPTETHSRDTSGPPCESRQPPIDSCKGSSSSSSSWRVVERKPTRRKSFLYIKRSSGSSSDDKCLLDQDEDLNNNNNNNATYYTTLAANKSSKFPRKQHEEDEHKTCLLLDEEPNDDKQQQQQQHQQDTRMSPSVARALATSQGGQHLFVASLLVAILAGFLVVVPEVFGQQPAPSPFSINGGAPGVGGGGGGPVPRSQAGQRPQPIAGSLVANINCNKIRGHVTLTPVAASGQQAPGGGGGGGGSQVSARILSGPPGEVYQWSVHQFPVKPGAGACTCSPMVLGAKLIDLGELHGNLLAEQEFSVHSPSLSLMGPESPVGHSLLLRAMKTGMLACATFLPTSRKSNYRAKFHSPLSGSISVFQTAFGTSLVSHLMYSNGTRRHSMHRFDLVHSEEDIITSAPLSGAPGLVGSLVAASSSGGGGLTASSQQRAAQLNLEQLAWEQREHELELSQCKRFPSGEPLLRNASYQLAVSTENFGMRGRTSLVLPPIPLETFSSVFVVVYSEQEPLEPMACAPLRFVRPKTAAAKFQSASVQGSIVLSQDSPFDPTLARVNLNLPNSDGHSYGIDELPMIIRRKSDTRVCPNIREIIYNPHQVEPGSVPAEGEATSDQYAVGDLSGKYGSLAGKPSEKLQVQDFNLPLFGPASVIGRAMTVYSAEGVAIACSNIELTAPMTTAFATFDFGIQGQFIFRQPVNDCNGDTYVYIEVSKPPSTGGIGTGGSNNMQQQQQQQDSRSLDHNWHIHTNPVDSGLDHLSSTECQPAGPHFNPYNTSTSHIYARDCTPFNGLRCELGDLSAKMFTLEIPPYRTKGGHLEPDIGKFFGTDIDLPLCGPVSIVNRSVVVHGQDFGSHRLACSTVIEFKPRLA